MNAKPAAPTAKPAASTAKPATPLVAPLALTLALAAAAAATAGCGAGDAGAGVYATRETLPGGGTLVRYGTLPPPASPAMTVDLRIGVLDGEPHEMFGDIRAIEVDDDGTIYVLDHQASEIRVFDADGGYLRTLGGRGQGPGEIMAANGMRLLPDGTLWVQDHGQWRMIALTPDGEELGRYPMHERNYGYFWNGTVDDRGRFWKPATRLESPPVFPPQPGLSERRARTYQIWFDPATEATDSVLTGERTIRMHTTAMAGGGWMNRGIPFEASPIELVDPAGGVWATSGDAYRVVRLDERGDTTLVIEADVAPEPVTREHRQRYIDSNVQRDPEMRRTAEELVRLAPETFPVIIDLTVDHDGRLWVGRRVAEGENPRYDAFTRDGEFAGSVHLEFRPMPRFPHAIRDGRLYTRLTDELGVHTVVRADLPPLAGSGR